MAPTLTFPKGGVHPPESKKMTEHLPVEVMPLPSELEIILGQHIGAPCSPTVARRAEINEGDLIGEVTRGLGVPIHAPAAGKIKALASSGHPIRVSSPSITLQVDKEAAPREWQAKEWQTLSSKIIAVSIAASCAASCAGSRAYILDVFAYSKSV